MDPLRRRRCRPPVQFERRRVIDLFGPGGLRQGPFTIRPARTLLAPGGTQLLHRSEIVDLTVNFAHASLSLNVGLPTRFGALVGKAAAMTLGDGRGRHLLDALHLAATLRPGDLDIALSRADRRWLRGLIAAAYEPSSWNGLSQRVELIARAALNRIADAL